MIGVSVTITERPVLLTPEAERVFDDGVEDALDVIADNIAGKASELAPRNATHLAASIFVDKSEGRGIRTITSPLPYAIVMEKGRTPGRRMPPTEPTDPIALWVRRVLKIDPSDKRFRSVVWTVRRKIAKRGIPAHHFFKRAAEYGEKKVTELWDTLMAETMRKLERRA